MNIFSRERQVYIYDAYCNVHGAIKDCGEKTKGKKKKKKRKRKRNGSIGMSIEYAPHVCIYVSKFASNCLILRRLEKKGHTMMMMMMMKVYPLEEGKRIAEDG